MRVAAADMEAARGPSSLCDRQASRTHRIHLQQQQKTATRQTTPFTKEKTPQGGQSSHTSINMTRLSPAQVLCLVTGRRCWTACSHCHWCFPWNDADCNSHREKASVGAAPLSGLARKHETQSLLKPHYYSSPIPVLKVTCNAVRTRGKTIRNCSPCNYWVLVSSVPTACSPCGIKCRLSSPWAIWKCAMRNLSPVS